MHSKVMGKVIRPTYPLEVSIGLILLVFVISLFLSHQIFEVKPESLNEGKNTYVAAFLVSTAVIIMMLVLWEEFLFPIKVKIDGKEVVFNNHRSKLRKQVVIYLAIPIIFIFLYLEYKVNIIRFLFWAVICTVLPVAGKLVSGIKNYNDFLKLNDSIIQYKNNEKEGTYEVKNIQHIVLMKDERKVLHKIQLVMNDNSEILIDIDEMEIEAFYASIDQFVKAHYKELVKETTAAPAR